MCIHCLLGGGGGGGAEKKNPSLILLIFLSRIIGICGFFILAVQSNSRFQEPSILLFVVKAKTTRVLKFLPQNRNKVL